MKKHKEGILLFGMMIAISAVLTLFLVLTDHSASASIPKQDGVPAQVAGAHTP